MNEPSTIEKILRTSVNVVVVGLSPNPSRPSHTVAQYLKDQGYRIIPVNPQVETVLGEKSYPSIMDVPHRIDVVDIFRRSEEVEPIVEATVKRKIPAVWMQEGVVNVQAATKAESEGLMVVMDKCMLKEHKRLVSEGKLSKKSVKELP